MERKLKFAIITAFLLLSLATISSASAAQVYNVTDSSYSNYFNTTGYINNTSVQAGDVFDISGDINNKDMYIDRPLNITSTDRTANIINGTITILSGGSGTNITHLNISNTNHNGNTPGSIVIIKSENNTIKDNNITTTQTNDDSFGIHLIEADNNRIIGNTIITTGNGNGTATGGNGKFTYGVYLDESSSNLFDSNTIKTTGTSADADWSTYPDPGIYATTGVYLKTDSNKNNFTNNTITTNYNEAVSSYGTLMGIRIIDGTGNKFTGNRINTAGDAYAYGVGIAVTGSSTASDNVISGNIINTTGAYYANGVEIGAKTKNTVVSQNIVKVMADSLAYGIYLGGSTSNLTGNKVSTISNINYVLELFSSNNNTITDNVLVGTGNYSLGIGTYGSNNNTIKHNTITTIGDDSAEHIYNGDLIPEGNEGIKLISNSNQNIIQYNIITSSAEYAINATDSSNNTLTNNYLISDNKQGNAAVTSGAENTITGNYGKKPTADFTVNTVEGTQPLTVEFVNTSQGDITKWAWDFDNDGTVDCEAPYTTYTYTKPGNYIAKLTVTGPGGSDSKIMYITVKPDTTVPSITSINPSNGSTKVAANKTIKVTFSEAIKKGSFWIELKNSAGKAVPFKTSINGKVLTVDPTGNLTESLYTLILHTGSVTDLAGNPLTLKTTKFSAGTSPKVTSTDPKNNAVKVSTNKTIKVTFNENIKKGNNWIELKNSAGKAVSFTSSVNSKVLTIKPKSKLTESQYKLILHTGAITDQAGNPLTLKTTKFSAGTSPKVTNTDPKNNAKNIARSKAIKVTFNENIKAGSNYWIELVASNGTKITIKKSIKGKTLTITPTKTLKANTKYKLILHTGSITDQAGNPLALKTINFTTRKT